MLKTILQHAIDTIFPPQCLSCRKMIQTDGNLCSDCWEGINFISAPQCDRCGFPFEVEIDDGGVCGQCIAKPPKYKKARAVFSYCDITSRMITGFKYGDKTQNSDHFARWMLRSGDEFIKQADLITPVPLHKMRLFKRRYNQSALLANSLNKISQIPHLNDLLIKSKNTLPQAGLPYNKRIKNVVGAFKINPKHQDKIKNKSIILIDDVMTTGSTIDACSRTLLKAGASEVYALTLATTKHN